MQWITEAALQFFARFIFYLQFDISFGLHKRIKRWQKRSMMFEIISHFSNRTKNSLYISIFWNESNEQYSISVVLCFSAKSKLTFKLWGRKKVQPWGYMFSILDEFLHLFHRLHFFLHSCRFSICSFDCFVFVCVRRACVCVCKWRWEEQTLFNVSLFNCCFFLKKTFFQPFPWDSNGFFSFVCSKFSVVIVLALMRIGNGIKAKAN